MTAEVRFWAKVDKTDSCWLWTASVNQLGYGRFRVDNTTRVTAHRYAYETLVGPIPDGQELDHLCRVRSCVNPAHLEPVSHRENVLRGTSSWAAHYHGRDCGNPKCFRNCKRFREQVAA